MPKPRSPEIISKTPRIVNKTKDDVKTPKKESKINKNKPKVQKMALRVGPQGPQGPDVILDEDITDLNCYEDIDQNEYDHLLPTERSSARDLRVGPPAQGSKVQRNAKVQKNANKNDAAEIKEFEFKSEYPEAITKLLKISLLEADQVREALKGRNRQNYVKIFQAYKDKLKERDYSIIRGATGYLYDYSRVNSIDEHTALWMLGIHEIPASQILSYTSKSILEKIAKDHGLTCSGKKAEVLIQNIRSVIDSSN
jgi:hypothetical protein